MSRFPVGGFPSRQNMFSLGKVTWSAGVFPHVRICPLSVTSPRRRTKRRIFDVREGGGGGMKCNTRSHINARGESFLGVGGGGERRCLSSSLSLSLPEFRRDGKCKPFYPRAPLGEGGVPSFLFQGKKKTMHFWIF